MAEATMQAGLTVERIQAQERLMRDNGGSCHVLDPELVGQVFALAKLALQQPDPMDSDPGDEAEEDEDPDAGDGLDT